VRAIRAVDKGSPSTAVASRASVPHAGATACVYNARLGREKELQVNMLVKMRAPTHLVNLGEQHAVLSAKNEAVISIREDTYVLSGDNNPPLTSPITAAFSFLIAAMHDRLELGRRASSCFPLSPLPLSWDSFSAFVAGCTSLAHLSL